MIIFPAVDIQNGQAVRLKRGQKEEATVFAPDPVTAARHWLEQGARWLHVVDLDGAFEGNCANAPLIGQICSELGIPVQVGGGIRTVQSAREYLAAGVTRIIIGTLALENMGEFSLMCQEFPNRIGVSLDARNGRLKTHGWLEDAGIEATDVLGDLEHAGASFVIYTDIERDGMRSGLNIEALAKLLKQTRLPIIAAGGVASLKDVEAAAELVEYGNLEGLISGRALYEGSLDLKEATALLDSLETRQGNSRHKKPA